MAFCVPVTAPLPATEVSPKLANSTLPSERFMALAISWVSRVAGTLLTQLMAKAMNRSLGNVLFANFGETSVAGSGAVTGTQKAIEASDAGVMMAYSQKIIIVPGYGMAVAQAQHKVRELSQLLIDHGVKVRFAIQRIVGRMPGHMNVLLAEAGVPYDLISDLDEIDAKLEPQEVALIIGANDVVKPDARSDASSPIYGMPILRKCGTRPRT